jgi:hypothetical protein
MNLITTRTSPTKLGHLVPGALYEIRGQGNGVDSLPTQVFRIESFERNIASGTVVLRGTLYWRMWIAGRAYSGTHPNHGIALHHVSVGDGARLSSQHDFHFERIERSDIPRLFGNGAIAQTLLRGVS